jgi:hypothetical protein
MLQVNVLGSNLGTEWKRGRRESQRSDMRKEK